MRENQLQWSESADRFQVVSSKFEDLKQNLTAPPQRPLFSVPKLTFVERLNCMLKEQPSRINSYNASPLWGRRVVK